MSKIYHYTTIDTLVLIMLNKTIRFNRLDKVDDEEEFLFGSGVSDVKIGKYIFVSCWTKDAEENPSLWDYIEKRGGKRNAVRIGLDEDIFPEYPMVKGAKTRSTFFPHTYEVDGDCYFHSFANELKLHDIQYVDDNLQRIKRLMEEGSDVVKIKINELGLYKNKEKWARQKESRFRLIAFPTTEKFESRDDEMGQDNVNFSHDLLRSIVPLLWQNTPISLNYKDLPLKKGVLDSIEVTMGPHTTKEDKEKVQRLLYPCPLQRIFSKRKILNSTTNN